MQAEGGTARLLLSRLTDKKEWAVDGARPEAESATFGQAEMQGIAAHFEDDSREGSTFDGRFRQPERILQLARRGMEKPFRLQPEILQPRSIRTTRLQCADGITDPEQRQQPAGILPPASAVAPQWPSPDRLPPLHHRSSPRGIR